MNLQKIISELQNREILKAISNYENFKPHPSCGIYVGFDPTADSLHLGNYIQLVILQHFKKSGFKPYIVIGGATGSIGDPSGKNSERVLLEIEKVNANIEAIKNQVKKFGIETFNNYDIYKETNVLAFLREVGKLINLNYMLSKEVVKTRIETGISFTEFSYQLIQGWDFKHLFEAKDVQIQFGGSDQWGNITTGLEIIRKKHGENQAIGFTTEFLTTKDGQKYGKSNGQPVWIDKNKTSPFELYQFLINTSDDDVIKLLKWLTFLSLEEIAKIENENQKNKAERIAQKKLAQEVVRDIHGQKQLDIAIKLTEILFGKNNEKVTENELSQLKKMLPIIEIKESKSILDFLTQKKVIQSKREGREFIEKGALKLNNQKISGADFNFDYQKLLKINLLQKGRKKHFLIIKK